MWLGVGMEEKEVYLISLTGHHPNAKLESTTKLASIVGVGQVCYRTVS